MKRSPLMHERVFADDFAAQYAQQHQKIAENLGREVAREAARPWFPGRPDSRRGLWLWRNGHRPRARVPTERGRGH